MCKNLTLSSYFRDMIVLLTEKESFKMKLFKIFAAGALAFSLLGSTVANASVAASENLQASYNKITYDTGNFNKTNPSSGIAYSQRDDAYYRVMVVHEENRSDGMYNEPYNTSSHAKRTGNLKDFDGTPGYVDRQVKLSNGHWYSHINLNGGWYWTDSDGLRNASSRTSETAPASSFGMSAYSTDGHIYYYNQAKLFDTQVDAAAKRFNQMMGKEIYIKTTSAKKTNMVIKEDQVSTGHSLAITSMNPGGDHCTLSLHVPKITNFTRKNEAILDIIQHEMCHGAGLHHSYYGNSSFLMWPVSSKDGSQTPHGSEVNALKMIYNLKLGWDNRHPLA